MGIKWEISCSKWQGRSTWGHSRDDFFREPLLFFKVFNFHQNTLPFLHDLLDSTVQFIQSNLLCYVFIFKELQTFFKDPNQSSKCNRYEIQQNMCVELCTLRTFSTLLWLLAVGFLVLEAGRMVLEIGWLLVVET